MIASDLVDKYEAALAEARLGFVNSPTMRALLDQNVDATLLEAFLIQYCSLGVAMTEPVERWVKGAAASTAKLGFERLAKALDKHARDEAGHHEMMIADTRSLVARWNAKADERPRTLDADALLGAPITPGVAGYQKLHEDVIGGVAPFGQLAIEYEIEQLSVNAGPQLIGRCVDVLGRDILTCLSFLEEHVAIDQGHTAFNRRQLERLLDEAPQTIDALIDTGRAALAAYGACLADCLERARAIVA
jgi:hypothetical protein